MILPSYMIRYLTSQPASKLGARESVLSVTRKSARITGLAFLALEYPCGPLRTEGLWGAVVSLNLDKSHLHYFMLSLVNVAEVGVGWTPYGYY